MDVEISILDWGFSFNDFLMYKKKNKNKKKTIFVFFFKQAMK